MPEKKRVFTPSSGYDIQLKIKDLDYTNDLRSVRIISGINTPYQIVFLDISIDPNDLILEDVMGKQALNLTIRLLGRKAISASMEEIKLELQYVNSESFAQSKPMVSEGKSKDRSISSIITICRKPFKTMTTMVNEIFMEKTPKEIITELATKMGAKVEYDSEGENKEKIDQVLIPPTTFYKTIRYLDDNFGLFNGASNLGFCQYDNVVHIQNLSNRINKNQTFTIFQLSHDNPDNKLIIDSCVDEKKFYSYSSLLNQYSGSAKFAKLAQNVKHVVKPKDGLFRVIDQKLNEVCSQFGAIAKNPEVLFDPNMAEREVYNIFHSGNDSSDIYAVVKMARQIIGLSTVELSLEKSLYIMNLMKVGEPVKLKCSTVEYIPLSGKYLLKASDIKFERNGPDWGSQCNITLCRTNQYI